MKFRILFFLLFFLSRLHAQQLKLQGDVVDNKGAPLTYATITLLHPDDSTLAYYAISNAEGHFEIKNISEGSYILQSAFIGYQTIYKAIKIPFDNNDVGALIMKPNSVDLKEAEITGERIPILIKKDTIEYNADSYKTKPDAAAEELLKKLPGVEVDRAGNIKAQGEEIKNVLVDGKEFFGNDPKVATKNLPADAVSKVQVYDKKSDETELTGIDDGTRNKTINLLLKDNKKSAWLGDVQAGAGTGSHYQSSAKAYRFTKQTQFAVLGMLNNINQFGFTFRDYIDFNGGMRGMMNGGDDFRITFENDNSFPVNFGQPVTGLITSGAGGLNYTYERKKDNRFNISYLGNGADKKLYEETSTQNFTSGNSFTTDETLDEKDQSRQHRFNFGWRNKIDSTQNIILNGSVTLNDGNNSAKAFAENFSGDTLQNELTRFTHDDASGVSGNAHVSYLKKGNSNWKLFKLGGDVSGSHNLTKNEWQSLAQYFSSNELINENLFRENKTDALKYSVTASVTRKIMKEWYIVPELKAGITDETLNREQGIPPGNELLIDSLSPHFTNNYQWVRPAISIKRSNDKRQFNFTPRVEIGRLINELNDGEKEKKNALYFVPRLSWENEYRSSHRLRAFYESYLNIPTAMQLLPVADNMNPLQVYSGNRNLKPEYIHDIRLNWIVFDQFSFTSIFAGIGGIYTKDKINWQRTVHDDFNQSLSLINVTDDYRADANVDFSTPIRRFGVNIHASAQETWNRGINYVNGIKNINTNFIHELTLSIDNRKKEKWDVNTGSTIQLTNARYSLEQQLNNNYFNVTYFSEIRFTPNDHWHFSATADITQYNARSFNESVSVPLLRAEVSHYFLKSNRGVVTIEAFDILNKNTGVTRISEMNYLQQKKSNIIGRYFILTFKYRLNKFDSNGGMDVRVNRR